MEYQVITQNSRMLNIKSNLNCNKYTLKKYLHSTWLLIKIIQIKLIQFLHWLGMVDNNKKI